ncbi:MAG: serine/threonine-protein kinase [Anaeromyxobacter sp.]
MTLNADEWPALSRLLDEALDLEPEARAAFVEALPPAQAHLREPLRMLLRAGRKVGTGFLADGLPSVSPPPSAPGVGDQVGPYVLLRELGKGGMGAVWLAERADGQLARRVALKLPRWAADPAGLHRRMARERDTLAAVEHPNIARLYDAGVDEAGRPWLAMEYVDGEPLDRYAEARDLPVRARLGLFLQVADAVALAHARLVVHRDLKPANVLVTAAGDVRLLDFGIAKLLVEGEEPSQTTELAGQAFTPDYAAPEQLEGRAVTVATDVYALGVLLYELLAGVRPYRLSRDGAGGYARALEEVTAPPPSAVAPAAARGALRGDLDVIVAKAMKREPAERYPTVHAFAQDVRRHLAGDPVLARPDGAGYRLRKFVARHRLAVSAAVALVVSLSAGLGTTLWQARRAVAERDRAGLLLARTTALGEVLDHLVQQAAGALDGPALRKLLADTAAQAKATFATAPDREATVLLALADYQAILDDRNASVALLERAQALLAGTADRDLAAQVTCKRAAWDQDSPGAGPGLERSRALAEDAGLEVGTRLVCLQAATTLARHGPPPDVGLALARSAVDLLGKVPSPSPRLRADVVARLGYAECEADLVREGIGHLEEALRLLAAGGLASTSMANQIRYDLADNLIFVGEPRAAEPLLREVVASFGPRDPPDVVLSHLAYVQGSLGDYQASYETFQRAADQAHRNGVTPEEANSRAGAAMALRNLGRIEEARRIALQAERTAASLPPDIPPVAFAHYVRGYVEVAAGNLGEARRASDRLFAADGGPVNRQGKHNAHRLRAMVELLAGELDLALEDAQVALEAAHEQAAGRTRTPQIGRAHLLLGEVQERMGKRVEALASYREARVQLAETAGAKHPDTLKAAEGARRLGDQG